MSIRAEHQLDESFLKMLLYCPAEYIISKHVSLFEHFCNIGCDKRDTAVTCHASCVWQARRSLFTSGVDDATTSVIHQYFFMKHHLRWTPPLMLTVYSRLDRGIQSATEMLPLRRGEGVVHSFYCTLHLSICALLTHLFITCLLAAVHLSFHLSVPCLSDY